MNAPCAQGPMNAPYAQGMQQSPYLYPSLFPPFPSALLTLPSLPYLATRILNLLLSSQEQQDVSWWLAHMDLHHRAYGGLEVVTLGVLQGRAQGRGGARSIIRKTQDD